MDLKNNFSFVSSCKYSSTAGLLEQNFNVTQSWLGIMKATQVWFFRQISLGIEISQVWSKKAGYNSPGRCPVGT